MNNSEPLILEGDWAALAWNYFDVIFDRVKITSEAKHFGESGLESLVKYFTAFDRSGSTCSGYIVWDLGYPELVIYTE